MLGVVLMWVVLPVKRWPFAIIWKCSKICSKDIDFEIFYMYPTILAATAEAEIGSMQVFFQCVM